MSFLSQMNGTCLFCRNNGLENRAKQAFCWQHQFQDIVCFYSDTYWCLTTFVVHIVLQAWWIGYVLPWIDARIQAHAIYDMSCLVSFGLFRQLCIYSERCYPSNSKRFVGGETAYWVPLPYTIARTKRRNKNRLGRLKQWFLADERIWKIGCDSLRIVVNSHVNDEISRLSSKNKIIWHF